MTPTKVLWPQQVRPDPNGLQRLARVLHWGLTALTVSLAGGAAINPQSWGEWVFGATVAFVFGRALRYIMAGE